MHTFTQGGFRIHYNSDFSGDAIISREASPANIEVAVPCDLLFDFVAERVRAIKIANLESASADEILLGHKETP